MRKNFLNTMTWRTTSILARMKAQTRLKIDGNVNAQLDILEHHVKNLSVKTILVIMVEHALNFLEVDICACVRLASMGITVNTVRKKTYFKILIFFT